MEDLRKLIREAPDFPKPGILFYDITTLLKDKDGLRGVIDGLKSHYQDVQVDVVLGIEACGFIFAPAVAYRPCFFRPMPRRDPDVGDPDRRPRRHRRRCAS